MEQDARTQRCRLAPANAVRLAETAEQQAMIFRSLPHSRQAAATLVCALALSGLPALTPAPAAAQTFGTDQGSCDRTALQSILSTSKGNIIGSLGGAALGGLVGSQFGGGSGKGIMTALGVVGGALAGGYVGRQMDPADHACVNRTLENTPTGQTVAWKNPDNGAQYKVTPTSSYKGSNGQPCRNFTTQAIIDGKSQQVDGTACRQADGSWKTASNTAANTAPTSTVSGDTIFKVQQKLHDTGFYVRDNIDGRWGPKSAAALQNYQRANGLSPTGQIDDATLAQMNLSPAATAGTTTQQ